jgi:hypothetical protein
MPPKGTDVLWSYEPQPGYVGIVLRSSKQYLAHLIVEHNGDLLYEEPVILFFDAVFGPDTSEIERWEITVNKVTMRDMLGELPLSKGVPLAQSRSPKRQARVLRYAANAYKPRANIADMSAANVVAELLVELRRPMVLMLLALRDDRLIDSWLRGEARPGDRHEYVLRLSLAIVEILRTFHSDQVTRKWFADRKSWLRGSTPLTVLSAIASGDIREVELPKFRRVLLGGATSFAKR